MKKRQDGRYQMSVTINGKKKFFYGKTKADVLEKIRDYKETDEKGLTISEVAELWWKEAVPSLAPSTVRGYTAAYNRAKKYMTPKYVNQVKPVDVSRYIKEMIKKFDLGHKSASNHKLVLKLIMQYAVEHGMIDMNPVKEVDVPKGLRKSKRKSPEEEIVCKIKETPESVWKTFAMLTMYAGLRRGEIIALRWEDFDWSKGIINIERAASYESYKPILKEAKTDTSNTIVPIHPMLAEYFVKRPKKGLVCPNRYGKMFGNSQEIRGFEKWRKEYDLNFTLHQLRHYYATILWENGMAPDEAQILLRHATLGITMDLYRDIREEKKMVVFDKMKAANL